MSKTLMFEDWCKKKGWFNDPNWGADRSKPWRNNKNSHFEGISNVAIIEKYAEYCIENGFVNDLNQ